MRRLSLLLGLLPVLCDFVVASTVHHQKKLSEVLPLFGDAPAHYGKYDRKLLGHHEGEDAIPSAPHGHHHHDRRLFGHHEKDGAEPSVPFYHGPHSRHLLGMHEKGSFPSVPPHHIHARHLLGWEKEDHTASSVPFHHGPHDRHLLSFKQTHKDDATTYANGLKEFTARFERHLLGHHDFGEKDTMLPSFPPHKEHHDRRLLGGDHEMKGHMAPSVPFHHGSHSRHLLGGEGHKFHDMEPSSPSIPFHHGPHDRHLLQFSSSTLKTRIRPSYHDGKISERLGRQLLGHGDKDHFVPFIPSHGMKGPHKRLLNSPHEWHSKDVAAPSAPFDHHGPHKRMLLD